MKIDDVMAVLGARGHGDGAVKVCVFVVSGVVFSWFFGPASCRCCCCLPSVLECCLAELGSPRLGLGMRETRCCSDGHAVSLNRIAKRGNANVLPVPFICWTVSIKCCTVYCGRRQKSSTGLWRSPCAVEHTGSGTMKSALPADDEVCIASPEFMVSLRSSRALSDDDRLTLPLGCSHSTHQTGIEWLAGACSHHRVP
jgi:hypothetical protein